MPAPPPGACPDRRRFLAAAASTALLPAASLLPGVAMASSPENGGKPFALADIALGDGPFARSQALNLRYLSAPAVDRLLAPYRIEAGLPPPAPKCPSWQSVGLDAHTAGHSLTALAQQAAQGHAGMRQRLDARVQGLAQCQRANGNG